MIPRNEGEPQAQRRLPPHLLQELAGLRTDPRLMELYEYEEDGPSAVRLFMEGILPDPDKPEACNDVAAFCLDFDLPSHFKCLPPPTELTIWETMNIDTVAACLEGSPRLHRLTFLQVHIDEEKARVISALVAGIPSLERLEIHADGSEVPASAVSALFSRPLHPALKALRLEGLELSGDMGAVARVLGASALEDIAIFDGSIEDEDLAILCSALEQNRTLETLDLSGSPFSDGTQLGWMLRKTSLKELNLNGCKAESTYPILKALEENDTVLEHLALNSVRGNGSQLYARVADTLRVNRTLSKVEISGGPAIGPLSLGALAHALKDNQHLRELRLQPDRTHTTLPSDCIDDFIAHVQQNSSLAVLHLNVPELSPAQREAIATHLRLTRERNLARDLGFTGPGQRMQMEIGRPPSRVSQQQLNSLHFRNQVVALLGKRDYEPLPKLCSEFAEASILEEHMDEVLDAAARTPGQLRGLVATLNLAGMRISASPHKLAELRDAALEDMDFELAQWLATIAESSRTR